MPMVRALKSQKYSTRRLQAGDEFEVSNRDMARAMAGVGLVEMVPESAPVAARRGPGRPPARPAAAKQPEPAKQPTAAKQPTEAKQSEPEPNDDDDYEDMTREALLELVEKRGIDVPQGYLRKDLLVQLLRKS